MGNPHFTSRPPVILKSGLSPCQCCVGEDLKGIIRRLGMCVNCAAKRMRQLEEAIAAALLLSDTGSEVHKEAFDPNGVGERQTGWRVAEKMRETLMEAVK